MQNKQKILIVDDDRSIRAVLRAVFEDQGFQTIEHSSGERVLETVQSENIALVTLDIVMEGSEGIETAIKLNQHCPFVPVIAISGYPQYLKMITEFVHDSMVKPIDFTLLSQKVSALLD